MNVLLIGAGTMGSVHAAAYEKMTDVRLIGIVDADIERAQQLAGADRTAYRSLEDAAAVMDAVDVIDICVPTYRHKEYVMRAADLGKAVICEKPLALTLADAKEMIRYCREREVSLFVGHVVRFFPEYRRAKTLLELGAVGDPAMVRTMRGGIFPSGWEDWYADVQKSGGLLLDLVIHDFDFLRWCFGEVRRVYAKGLHGRANQRLDYALTSLRFQSGVIAHVEGTWAHEGFSMKYEIAGSKGIIDFDSEKEKPLVVVPRTKENGFSGVAVPESPLQDDPYYRELRHFIDCIRSGAQALVTADDAYQAMRISHAAIRSVQTGEPVEL